MSVVQWLFPQGFTICVLSPEPLNCREFLLLWLSIRVLALRIQAADIGFHLCVKSLVECEEATEPKIAASFEVITLRRGWLLLW